MAILKKQGYYEQRKFKGKCDCCGQEYLELSMDILTAENINLNRKLEHNENLWLKKYAEMKKPEMPKKGNWLELILCKVSTIPDNYRYTWKDFQRAIRVYRKKIKQLQRPLNDPTS